MAEKVQLEIEVKGGDTVGKASTKVESLKKQIKDIKELLASGSLGQQEFDELSKKAGEMNDRLIETNNIVKNLSQSKLEQGIAGFVDIAQGIAGGFAAAQGAMALFGDENEELQKTLIKVQGAAALLSGVQAVSNVLQKDSAAMSLLNTTRLNILTAAQARYTAVVGGTTGALKALRIVGATLGIGLIVAAIALLISKFDKIKEVVGKFIPSLETLGKFFKMVWQNITDFVGATSDATREVERFEKANEKKNRLLKDEIELMKASGKEKDAIYKAERQLLSNSINALVYKYKTLKSLSTEESKLLRELNQERKVLDASYEKSKSDALEKEKEEANKNQKQINENYRKRLEEKKQIAIKAEEERIAVINKLNQDREAIELESLLRTLDAQDREIAELRLKYQDKYIEFKNDAETTKLLTEQLNADVKAINDKYAKQASDKLAQDLAAEKAAKEKAAKEDLENKQIIEAAKYSIVENGAKATMSIAAALTRDQEKQNKISKASALIQIGTDTAKAISSLTAASEANPTNAVTFGAAGAAQFVAGIARIAANIGQAVAILGGGGSNSIGLSPSGGGSNNQTPNINGFYTGSNQGNQNGVGSQPQRIYVTETDIRKASNRVSNIYSQATVE